jgi:hypothetical protein
MTTTTPTPVQVKANELFNTCAGNLLWFDATHNEIQCTEFLRAHKAMVEYVLANPAEVSMMDGDDLMFTLIERYGYLTPPEDDPRIGITAEGRLLEALVIDALTQLYPEDLE